MTRSGLAIGILGLCVGACDPGVHLGWEKDFSGKVDFECIQSALKKVAPDVTRTSWSDPNNDEDGFPRGTQVTQFNYSDPSAKGSYQLNVARLPNGLTHYQHKWGKLGTKIPAEEQKLVLPLLYKTNASVSRECGLNFDDVMPTIGDG
ncbi:hypothetical protein [Sphingomonas sp. ASV193]|uniref:hypothetical protein n=1 Tax=Sphingomonas sp. ASV193 TaxID=3144405 RepID=UPI0032E93069